MNYCSQATTLNSSNSHYSVKSSKKTCSNLRYCSIKSTPAEITELLELQLNQIQTDYNELLNSIYFQAGKNALMDKDISTLQNMNRELYSAHKSLTYAISDFMLDNQQSEQVKNLPLIIQ